MTKNWSYSWFILDGWSYIYNHYMLTLASNNGHIDITKILRWLYGFVHYIVDITNTNPIFCMSHIYNQYILRYILTNNMTNIPEIYLTSGMVIYT